MRHLFYILLIVSVFYELKADNNNTASEKSEKKVRQINGIVIDGCEYEEDKLTTQLDVLYDFGLKLWLKADESTNGNFIVSPHLVLLSIAALLEGSEEDKSVHNAIDFPSEKCMKQLSYKFLQSREQPGLDVSLLTTRALVVDENLLLNRVKQKYVPLLFQQLLLKAPIKSNPLMAAYAIRQTINFQFQGLNFNGNSVILDFMEYTGLWQKSFPVLLERQPFYNYDDKQTGWVDMMKTKMRVRMSYIDDIKLKIVELPVGSDGRYRMFFTEFTEKVDYRKIIEKLDINVLKTAITNMKESKIPIEIQIPRFNLNSELDMRNLLEKFGVTTIWTLPSVTRHISEPAALPSSYIQRTNIYIEPTGVNPPELFIPTDDITDLNEETGLDPAIGRNFTANKPLFIGLFDAEFFTPLFLGIYSVPTYSL